MEGKNWENPVLRLYYVSHSIVLSEGKYVIIKLLKIQGKEKS